jgi:hypothetical protein
MMIDTGTDQDENDHEDEQENDDDNEMFNLILDFPPRPEIELVEGRQQHEFYCHC